MNTAPRPSLHPAMTKPTTTRLDYLDATRAFALLLGVVFHASLSFLPVFIGWAVQDVSTSGWVGVFITISHSFRMELFFLLAGFFSHMSLQRKDLIDLLRSRLTRIAVPFIFGWFILQPLIVSGWTMGFTAMRGDYNFWASIGAGFQSLKQLPSGLLVGTHLWFLYYLLLVTSLTLVIRTLILKTGALADTVRHHIDRTMRWFSASSWTSILATIPIAIILNFMNNWGVDTPDKSLVPHLPVTLIYGGFFGLGWLLDRQPDLIAQFSEFTWPKAVILLLAIAVTISLAPIQSDPGHPDYRDAHLLYNVSYAAMMWSLVWFTIGLFRKLCRQPNTVIRYVADSSYWMYLLHLPVVVWLQVAISEAPLNWIVKLAIVSLGTIGFCLLTYDLFVRSTFLGALINGRRRPRAIFARKSQNHSPSLETA